MYPYVIRAAKIDAAHPLSSTVTQRPSGHHKKLDAARTLNPTGRFPAGCLTATAGSIAPQVYLLPRNTTVSGASGISVCRVTPAVIPISTLSVRDEILFHRRKGHSLTGLPLSVQQPPEPSTAVNNTYKHETILDRAQHGCGTHGRYFQLCAASGILGTYTRYGRQNVHRRQLDFRAQTRSRPPPHRESPSPYHF